MGPKSAMTPQPTRRPEGHRAVPPDAAHAELAVPEDAGSVQRARRFVSAQLARWSVDATVAGDAVLVASELVTNALRHGRAPRSLELELSPERLWIAVGDAGPGRPRHRPFATDREGGRGLALLEALGADWGFESKPADGKRVWCELALS